MVSATNIIRQPYESLYKDELEALKVNDKDLKPEGWLLSPKSVRKFILGSSDELKYKNKKIQVSQKFYGDSGLIDRCIVTLMSNRALMLVGDPGTAKSMLSELLAAAISGQSSNTIQGTAGTTEDQIYYSWNYALLIAEGPSENALIPAPIYLGMKQGHLVRFEEITRCAPEIQDALIGALSESQLKIPELKHQDTIFAKRGFNIIATANLRDRGVNEMSSALKRRFNFETVMPISDTQVELELVQKQAQQLLVDINLPSELDQDILNLLVTTFQDLRFGKTEEGHAIDRPSTVMSTAEAVSVAYSAALEANYFNNGVLKPGGLVKQLLGTAIKDNKDDIKKVQQYFEIVVKQRGKKSKLWKDFYNSRKYLDIQ